MWVPKLRPARSANMGRGCHHGGWKGNLHRVRRRQGGASGVRGVVQNRRDPVQRGDREQGGAHRRGAGACGARGARGRRPEAQHRSPRARAPPRGGHGRRLPSRPFDEAGARYAPRRRQDRRDRRRGHRPHRNRHALDASARSRRRRRKRGDQAALLPRKVPDEVLDKLEEQAALRLAGNRSCLRGGSRPGAGVRA